MTKQRAIVLIALLSGLLLTGVVLARGPLIYAIRRSVVGGGGGRSNSAGYLVNGTIGQGVVHTSSSAGYRLRSGFWPGMAVAAPGPSPTPTHTRTVTPTHTRTATPTHTPTVTSTLPPGVVPRAYLPILMKNLFWP